MLPALEVRRTFKELYIKFGVNLCKIIFLTGLCYAEIGLTRPQHYARYILSYARKNTKKFMKAIVNNIPFYIY